MMTATAGRTPCEKRIYILLSNVATSLSSKYKELGHFTLLFCRGRQRNAPRFKMHIKPFVWCRPRLRRRRGLLKLPIVRWETGHAFYVIGLKNIGIHPSTRYQIRCGYIFFHFGERIYFFRIRCRIRRIRVDGSRIRNEKVADSKISGYVWTGPKSGKTYYVSLQCRRLIGAS